ncbi:hypothetical protein AVEN_273348-1 [Araneus ventricosus]|uniref:Tc1-like transposase DDE domain-containing protein n=1 Tax=Araneus ventricosus TaxID=182803 RepID=A0A4Y2MJK9_ARAVE|nr:hypothetical protein AVEN_273348-1 [Araneus ventricosus]
MTRTTPELAPPLQASAPHQLQAVWPLRMIWRATGPIHGGSSVESGFEPGTFRSQGRDLTITPPRPSQDYKDGILDAYVLPYARAIGDDFLLQDDNAIPHRFRIVDDYLQFSAWSGQLDHRTCPIEHVWDALRRRIAALNPPPQTLATLAAALQEQWLALPTELIDRIIDSITHRCTCGIASRGIILHI